MPIVGKNKTAQGEVRAFGSSRIIVANYVGYRPLQQQRSIL
jgi:hypothetical protein